MSEQSGSKWWIWILLLVGLPVLCMGGCCVAFIGLAAAGAKNNSAYVNAIPLVETNPQLIDKLGSPIEASFPTSVKEEINSSGSTSNAVFSVSGPQGTGTANASANKIGEVWEVESLTVTIDSTNETVVIK